MHPHNDDDSQHLITKEDGSDPRRFHDRRFRDRPQNQTRRKAWQLCRQVEWALRSILATCSREAVRELTILSVSPAPHSGRLKVAVSSSEMSNPIKIEMIETQLETVGGWIRCELAASINRRNVPELVWHLT